MSLIAASAWVLLATAVAFLPMRHQYAPGLALLIAAPCLLGWIAWDHGGWLFAAGTLAFVSMFRNPLIYLVRRIRGERPEIPT